MCSKVISPQINESTIHILNRHGVEVYVAKEVGCCGSLNHHLGKEELAKESFIKILMPGMTFVQKTDRRNFS